MRVLVTGASGYVGSRLVPELLAAGHQVKAAFTDPRKASRYFWAPQVEVTRLDLLDARLVRAAVGGVDAICYLVHGMSGADFAAVDRECAENVVAAAQHAGVQRVVYLSGLVPQVPEPDLSEHITSRLEVERILAAGSLGAITLRAAIVTGAGSTSFEIVRQISERLAVHTIPTWMDSRVQPIAVVDVVAALVGALTVRCPTRTFDVGGPDVLPYTELLQRYAAVAGLTRPQVPVPGLPTDLVGLLAGLVTDVPAAVVQALVESLHHDMVCHEQDFRTELLPPGYRLLGVEESFRRALARPPREVAAERRDPMGPMPHDPSWAGGTGGGIKAAIAAASAVLSGIAPTFRPGW